MLEQIRNWTGKTDPDRQDRHWLVAQLCLCVVSREYEIKRLQFRLAYNYPAMQQEREG